MQGRKTHSCSYHPSICGTFAPWEGRCPLEKTRGRASRLGMVQWPGTIPGPLSNSSESDSCARSSRTLGGSLSVRRGRSGSSGLNSGRLHNSYRGDLSRCHAERKLVLCLSSVQMTDPNTCAASQQRGKKGTLCAIVNISATEWVTRSMCRRGECERVCIFRIHWGNLMEQRLQYWRRTGLLVCRGFPLRHGWVV